MTSGEDGIVAYLLSGVMKTSSALLLSASIHAETE